MIIILRAIMGQYGNFLNNRKVETTRLKKGFFLLRFIMYTAAITSRSVAEDHMKFSCRRYYSQIN